MATLGPSPDPVAVLRAHKSAVNALAFHPSSGRLLSGDADGEIKIWDMVRRRPLSSSRVHPPSSGVIGIGTGRHLENKILSQSRDGTVKCWQLGEGGLSRQPLISIKTESYHFCRFSVPYIRAQQPDTGDRISGTEGSEVSSSLDGGGRALIAIAGEEPSVVEIWDVDGGKRVEQLKQPKRDSELDWESSSPASAGMCMAVKAFQTEEGGFLNVVSGYEDGSMAVWDLRNPQMPLIRTRLHSEPVLSLNMDTRFASGVSGAADDKLIFFDLNLDKGSYQVREEVVLGKPGIADIVIRQDDRILATAGWDNRVRIYNYGRRKPLAVLKYHAAGVTGVIFSEDQKLLVSSSNDSTIALWSIYPP